MNDPARLTHLEERYAHLQRHQVSRPSAQGHQQDKVMLDLGKEVEALRKELVKLRARAPGEAENNAPPDERPPHY